MTTSSNFLAGGEVTPWWIIYTNNLFQSSSDWLVWCTTTDITPFFLPKRSPSSRLASRSYFLFPTLISFPPLLFLGCWRGRLLVACKWINCEWKWSTIQTEQRERKLKHYHVSVFNLPRSGFHFQSFTNQFRKFVTDQSTKLLYILFCSVYSNCGFHFSESRCY